MDRKSWPAWGDEPEPQVRPHKSGTLGLLSVKLRRLGPTRPTTPTDDQEGQLRYDRDGDVDGVLSLARHRVGGALEWGSLLTTDLTANLIATGADPVITNTPVGTYPGAGDTPGSVSVLGNDTAFRISFDTGTTPATGLVFHVAFAAARASSNYAVWFTPATSAAVPVPVHATSRTVDGFDVSCVGTAPAASSTVAWGLLVIGF